MVNGLAQVMEKAGSLGDGLIKTEFGCHDAAKSGDLNGVLKDILAKGGAVPQCAKRLDELGVQVVDAGVEGSLLASLLDALVDELLSLLVHLFDTRGVDAPVSDEILEGNAGGLPADRIETREDNRLGSIVDDQRDTGDLLEGADVSPRAADDAPLEVIGGNVDGRDGNLTGLVGSAALDGSAHDLARGLVGLSADPLLGVPDDLGLVPDDLVSHAIEKLAVGVVAREVCDALELGGLTGEEVVDLVLAAVDLALLAGELVLLAIERVVATVEGLLALHDAILHRLELLAPLALVSLALILELEDLLARLDECGLLRRSRILLGGINDLGSLALGVLEGAVRLLDLRVAAARGDEVRGNCTDDQAHKPDDNFHSSLLR